MSEYPATHRWFGREAEELSATQRMVLSAAKGRSLVSRDVNAAFSERLTFGQRLADKVAEFGGSWSFIIAFTLALVAALLAKQQEQVELLARLLREGGGAPGR